MTVGGIDRHIPLLREVYEQFPEIPINIDIKVNNDELIRKVRWYVVHYQSFSVVYLRIIVLYIYICMFIFVVYLRILPLSCLWSLQQSAELYAQRDYRVVSTERKLIGYWMST